MENEQNLNGFNNGRDTTDGVGGRPSIYEESIIPDKKEIKILLTESSFSQVVKMGRIIYSIGESSQIEITLTSMDVREICAGKILMKKVDEQVIQIAITQIPKETIREILKRTPLYSSISEEII